MHAGVSQAKSKVLLLECIWLFSWVLWLFTGCMQNVLLSKHWHSPACGANAPACTPVTNGSDLQNLVGP